MSLSTQIEQEVLRRVEMIVGPLRAAHDELKDQLRQERELTDSLSRRIVDLAGKQITMTCQPESILQAYRPRELVMALAQRAVNEWISVYRAPLRRGT